MAQVFLQNRQLSPLNIFKPVAKQLDGCKVEVNWITQGDEVPENYVFEIFYKPTSEVRWMTYPDAEHGREKTITLKNLKPETKYVFKVRMVSTIDGNPGPYSLDSNECKTSKSLAARVIEECAVKEQKENLQIYQVPVNEVVKARNNRMKTRKFTFGEQSEVASCMQKTILLVGATGSGKTTLVNAMANYLLGVKWHDPFRFCLVSHEDEEQNIDEALSQTRWISCYTIFKGPNNKLKYTINIVDTPGFGSTDGIKGDESIVEQVRSLLESNPPTGIQTVNAVCFVVKAPDTRFTVIQEYVFKSILSLFGKDIEGNICTIVTFIDGNTPPVLSCLKALPGTPIPYEEYFPVNNSALFASNDKKSPTYSFSEMFWGVGRKNLKSFFKKIQGLPEKSLRLTASVLARRAATNNTLINLHDEIEKGLIKIDSAKKEIEIFKVTKSSEGQLLYFMVEELYITKLSKPKKAPNMICHTCQFTCIVNTGQNSTLENSFAFNDKDDCLFCPNHCQQEHHEIAPIEYKKSKQTIKKTYKCLGKQLEDEQGNVFSPIDAIQKLKGDIEEAEDRINFCLSLIEIHNDVLQETAFLEHPLSAEQYVDMMIKNEDFMKKDGYESRITILLECKQKARFRENVKVYKEKTKTVKEHIKRISS